MKEAVIEWPSGRRVRVGLGRQLGPAGSQGAVWTVEDMPEIAVKFLRTPDPYSLGRRLATMHAHPLPETVAALGGVTRVAWPTGRALEPVRMTLAGYTMPRLVDKDFVPAEDAFTQEFRDWTLPSATWLWYVQVALALADLVGDIQKNGHVVGDLAPANIFVTARGQVALVDVDGWQISGGPGLDPLLCPFSRSEYTAPELLDRTRVHRSPSSDWWALAVLVAQFLTIGVHPFAGIAPDCRPPFDAASNVRAGRSWLLGEAMKLPSWAPPRELVPQRIRDLLATTFGPGYHQPGLRPDPQTWVAALSHLQGRNARTTCAKINRHVYPRELTACPWCDIEANSGLNRFPHRPVRSQ